MTNSEIEKELERADKFADKMQGYDLYLIITNNIVVMVQNAYNYLYNYREKRIAKGTFDNIQFVKAVYNTINNILAWDKFHKYYSYSKMNVSVPTRYYVAELIANNMD